MESEKIKVVTIITKLELGGAQQIALYTASNLNNEKYKSYFISGEEGLLDNDAKNMENIEFYQVKSMGRHINPLRDLRALYSLYRIFKKIKPDIVHTHSSKAGILGRWAAHFAGTKKIVHTYHGFGFNDFQRFIVRFVYIFVEWITAFITDKLIVVSSENTKKALKVHIGKKEKYEVIHCAIDIEEFSSVSINKEEKIKDLGLPQGKKIVGMVACFKHQKSPVDFVRTARLVKKVDDNTIFVMVGDGILRKDIEDEIKKQNLENTVFLLGWRNDVKEILKIFDVFLLTSLWEGLPMVILQSMASCVPVIATAVDGTKEVINDGENGYLVDCYDIEDMAKKVKNLLDNDDLRLKFIENAKNTLTENFNQKDMVEKIQNLYQDIVYTTN